MSETHPSGPAATEAGSSMDRRIARPRRRRTLGFAAAGATVVAAIVGLLLLLPPPGSLVVKAGDVESAAVVRAPFQDYLPVRADVTPLRTVFLTAISGGQVGQLLVQDGQSVTADAALATLSNPQLRLDVSSREAEIAGRMGDVSAQQLGLERNRIDRDKEIGETSYNLLKAQRELEVRRGLHAKGFVSDAGVKIAGNEAAYYEERLKSLRSGARQEDALALAQAAEIRRTADRLRSTLAAVEAGLSALVVRAPVAGRLTGFTLQPGQSLKAGDPIGQIDSEGAYKLAADVDEFYLSRVSPGLRGAAEVDGAALPLTVSRVLPQVTAGRFRVELTFDRPPPADLRRGQALDVRITLGDTRPAVVAPNGGWLDGGGTTAFVLDASGRRAERRAVQLGRRNPEQVEVASGLRPGERIVTSSYAVFAKSRRLIVH